jgi:hypothetical protein
MRGQRRPAHLNYPEDLIEFEAVDKHGRGCGNVEVDLEMPVVTSIGKFALMGATDDGGLWALLLQWEDEVAERWGVVKLSKDAILNCLPPGPRWKAIVLE